MKHTPGPWAVGYSSPENIESSCLAVWPKADLDAGFGTVICKVSPVNTMNETDKANADLIALSPKLLFTITRCQAILAEHVLPDSKMTADECINQLLEVLDHQDLVKQITPLIQSK